MLEKEGEIWREISRKNMIIMMEVRERRLEREQGIK